LSVLRYVLKDLLRNPRRTLASVAGVALAVGLFSGVAFFVDSSASQMTARAIAPVAIDMQAGLTQPLGTLLSRPADLAAIRNSISAVRGVSATEPFALFDLPAGRLRAGGTVMNQPVKVLAVNPSYLKTFPVISVSDGSFQAGTALLSQPAADLLLATPGASLTLAVPGVTAPVVLPRTGIADFSSPPAAQLFASRNPDTQGDVVAAPYVVVVDYNTFQAVILPGLRADAASPAPVLSSPPVVEYHLALSHSLLSGDPANAVIRTAGLRRTIERAAPGELKVIDNLTDALTAAGKDATLAKVLFLFLGLPGVLLAAYLSRYAGSLLAQAQRRERATLRARGMQPAQTLRALAYNTTAVALLGATVGLALGFGALALLFGGSGLAGISAEAYGFSIAGSLLAAAVTTTLALYLPARRALSTQVADERREVEVNLMPGWLRTRLDLALLAAAALIGGVTYVTGGYKPTPIEGQSISLSFYILLAPIFFWAGATLLLVRLLLVLIGRGADRPSDGDFSRALVLRTLVLSVTRRPHAIAAGVVALSLAVAFGASLAIFVNTYQVQKLADARFVVGGDVRATPAAVPNSASAPKPTVTADAAGAIPGVRGVSPMDQATVVVGTEKRTLAAIDPLTFGGVAAMSPGLLSGLSPDRALRMLAHDPTAVLMDTELSRAFNIQVGDTIKVQVTDRTTGKPVLEQFHAVAIFQNFPGFPQGVDLVANLAFYQRTVHVTAPGTFLIRTDGTDSGTAAVATAVRRLGTPAAPVAVETTAKAYNLDQSSLSSLNVSGLGRLEGLYTVLMSALGVAIFVFGLLLQRAKEHVTMRALGLRMVHLQGLVLGEAGFVALVSLVIGGVVGTAMAMMFVQILRPLFVIQPAGIAVPGGTLALLAALVLVVTGLSSVVAGASLRRLRLVEILREE